MDITTLIKEPEEAPKHARWALSRWRAESAGPADNKSGNISGFQFTQWNEPLSKTIGQKASCHFQIWGQCSLLQAPLFGEILPEASLQPVKRDFVAPYDLNRDYFRIPKVCQETFQRCGICELRAALSTSVTKKLFDSTLIKILNTDLMSKEPMIKRG
jgi:hypothetical protein